MDFHNSDLEPLSLWNLDKGEFFDRNEIDIPQGGAAITRNVLFLDGKIRPRPGCVLLNSPTPFALPVHHLAQNLKLTTTTSNLVASFLAADRLHVYEYDGGWLDLSAGGVLGVQDAVNHPVSVNFKGNLYLIGGNGDLMVQGPAQPSLTFVSTLQPTTALHPPPRPRLLAVAPDRLFLANVIDQSTGLRVPFRLHWCDHLAPEKFGFGVGAGTANFVDLAEDNEPITGLHTYSDTVTVFKPRMIYTGKFVGGQEIFDFRILADGPGCVAHRTITRYRDAKFIFLGDENVYMARPGELPQAIGEAIQNRIQSLVDLATIDQSTAFCDICNDLYWLFMPKVGTSEVRIIFVCDLEVGAWYEGEIATNNPITASTSFREERWASKMILGASGGEVYEYDFNTTDDDGNAFSAFWESGLFSVERITKGKSQTALVEQARCFSNTDGGQVQITIKTKDGLDEEIDTDFGTQTFGVDTDHFLTERASGAAGEFFKLRFSYPAIPNAAFVQGVQVALNYGGGVSPS